MTESEILHIVWIILFNTYTITGVCVTIFAIIINIYFYAKWYEINIKKANSDWENDEYERKLSKLCKRNYYFFQSDFNPTADGDNIFILPFIALWPIRLIIFTIDWIKAYRLLYPKKDTNGFFYKIVKKYHKNKYPENYV